MGNGILKGIQSMGKWVVILLGGAILAGLFGLSVATRATMDLYEHSYYLIDGLGYRIGAVLLCVVVLFVLRKYRIRWVPGKRTRILLTILVGVAMAAFVLRLGLVPRADQARVLKCAQDLEQGQFTEWDVGGYLYIYPYQNALVLAFFAVFKVFGAYSWIALQLANVLMFLASAFFLADTVRLLFGSHAVGAWSHVALLLFFPLALYVTFVYGTLIGLALLLCGLWLILRSLKIHRAVLGFLGALLVALSAVVRVMYLVPIVAVLIALLFFALKQRRLKPVAYVAAVVVFLIAGNAAVSWTIERMTGIPTNEGSPTVTRIAMGLQDSKLAPGWYNRYILNVYVENDYDEAATSAAAKASIRDSLRGFLADKKSAGEFFARKIASQWNNGTFQGIWNAQHRNMHFPSSGWMRSLFNETGFLFRLASHAGDMLLPAIWLGALLFLAFGFREHDVFSLMLVIAFIGGFFFSLIWEGKCHYTVTYVFMLIPCAVRGYQLAATRPMRPALPLGAPLAALACCVIVVIALAFPVGKAEKAYADMLWRTAGGAIPAGTYEITLADGRNLACEDGALTLTQGSGTIFVFEFGELRVDAEHLALEAKDGSSSKRDSTVELDHTENARMDQRWYMTAAEGGGYYIRFRETYVMTSLPDGRFALEEMTGDDDQRWYFTPTED